MDDSESSGLQKHAFVVINQDSTSVVRGLGKIIPHLCVLEYSNLFKKSVCINNIRQAKHEAHARVYGCRWSPRKVLVKV